MEFGRKILYRIPCKPEGGLMTERWVPGIWLGKRFLSDERLVGIEDGSVCVSSSVRLMPDSESWSVEWVNKIRGTHRDLAQTVKKTLLSKSFLLAILWMLAILSRASSVKKEPREKCTSRRSIS